jgi:hypothetical protein
MTRMIGLRWEDMQSYMFLLLLEVSPANQPYSNGDRESDVDHRHTFMYNMIHCC